MFSKQLIVELVDHMPNFHLDLEKYLIKKDLDDKIDFLPGDSVEKKKSKIRKFLISNQGIKDNFGNDIVINIAEDAIKTLCDRYGYDNDNGTYIFNQFPDLYKYLKFDGYDIDFDNGTLIRVFPDNTSIEKKEDNILDFLKKYRFNTTKGHYEQAKGSYLDDNLAALNGQLRTFTESLFMEMAGLIKEREQTNQDIVKISCVDATTSMQVLAKCSHPILDVTLNEWIGNGKGYMEAFWKRLHPQGSHPGLPELDEVVYRFHLVIFNISYIINCFKRFY